MWENIKKKMTNFIYEEIEDDEEYTPSTEVDPQGEMKQKSSRDDNKRPVKTRMTFQYPKQKESFRFPVIPDQQLTQQKKTHKEESPGRSTESIQPAFVRRKNRERRPPYRRRQATSRPLYEQKKLVDDLENIPAYERRRYNRARRHRSTEDSSNKAKESALKLNQVDRNRLSYSKPAELDALFRRKNAPGTSKPIESNKDEITVARQELPEKKKPIEKIEHQTGEEPTQRQVKADVRDNKNLVGQAGIQQSQEDSQHKEPCKLAKAPIPSIEKEREKEDGKYKTQSQAYMAPSVSERQIDKPEVVDLPFHLLDDVAIETTNHDDWLQTQEQLLQQTLEHFNVDAEVVAVTQGPTVTRIEIQPALGVKVSRIRNLSDDIKLNLAARDIRIEAPIPGKHTVGIEIPNESAQIVHLQEMLESPSFQKDSSPLTVALGLTIEGEPYFTDINKMPHGLIAGATGSGKSVCINTMILSLLYKAHYEEVKLMLIDPKMVELTQYNGIPHLLTPVITDAKAATAALKWAVEEMERRYELFVKAHVRNIQRYNRHADEKLPYIVIIIDELADLMLVSPQEVEDYISRIAQKARAAGIHLILATQRPSVDVITGLIKANIPSRIAFAVSSQVDSRTILDANGAEKLLGKGDMLFVENGMNKQLRLQGPFVSDDEIDRVVHYLRSVAEPEYLFEHEELFLQIEDEEVDELFEEVVQFVIEKKRASTSLLQRRFRIGYNRAARLIDSMHDQGIISAQNGSRPREVLITKTQWEDRLNNH